MKLNLFDRVCSDTPGSPLASRRQSDGVTGHDRGETPEAKRRLEQCCGFVRAVLQRAQEEFPGVRSELEKLKRKIVADFKCCLTPQEVVSLAKYRLREAAENNGLPPNVVAYLQQRLRKLG